jgi:hypothetical protein
MKTAREFAHDADAKCLEGWNLGGELQPHTTLCDRFTAVLELAIGAAEEEVERHIKAHQAEQVERLKAQEALADIARCECWCGEGDGSLCPSCTAKKALGLQ